MSGPRRLLALLSWLAAAAGATLIGQGLLSPDNLRWRVQLLLGLLLLAWPLQRLLSRRDSPFAHGLSQLLLGAALGFTAIGLQLVRSQVTAAPAILALAQRELVAQAPPPQATPAPPSPAERTELGQDYAWPVALDAPVRGTIFDRNGVVLATTRDGRRVYPNPDLGHLVGFASRLYGTSGVENSFAAYLDGTASLSPTEVLAGRLFGTPVELRAADVELTLDSNLQAVAQSALGERAGAVVLLDTQTGAILAMASYPRFDPNTLVLPAEASEADVAEVQAAYAALTARQDSPLLNRAAQGRYPPGSVIKTLTAAAALDSGVVAGPEGQVTCPNQLPTEAGAPPVVNAVPNLAQRTGDPSDMRRIFAFSCNTAFAQLGLALGAERFADYGRRLGLQYADTVSGAADLRDIAADIGTIANNAAFLQRPAALADTAYGQGQALVTPLDMAQLVAAVGNDGRIMRPYLVQEARLGERVIYAAQPEALRELITPQAAQQLRSVMQTSVEIGYAAPVALNGVTIGAKTGTAETAAGTPHSWFMALAPVEQPRIAVAVIVEYGGEGSRSALPVARQVLAAALGVLP